MNTLQLAALAVLAMLLAAIGAVIGYSIHDTPQPEEVAYRPAVRQPDGSLIAERVPTAKPSPPPHVIPRGHTEVRRITTTVKPKDCPPLRIDTSLVRDREGGQRVIVSSPDAEVLAALDVPIVPALLPPPPRRWAAGLSYDHFGRGGGVWMERDVGRLRIGADVQADGTGEFRALVRAGWTF